jgi:peptide/nickel transport system substrate-binding protein
MKRRGLSLIALVFLSLMFVAACGAQEPAAQVAPVIVEKEVIKEVMVPGETIVVTKEVVVEVPVEKIVTVEKEVVKEVIVPGETVTVTKEVVKEVMVPGETIVVTKEVVKEVMVPGETIVVEKVVEKEVIKVVEKEVIKLVEIDRPPKVLKISTSQDIRTFTPYPSESGTILRAFGLIYSNLVSIDPININIAPELAWRWDYAPDGMSITFHLREGVTWHDGAPFTSKDVAFSIELSLDPTFGRGNLVAIKGGEAYRLGEADTIPGVVVIDDFTIRFDFEQATGTFLSQLTDFVGSLVILPEHILGKIADRSTVSTNEFFLKPIGTGAFKMSGEVIAGQGFKLVANDDYFFGRPKIDEIVFRVITSGDAAYIALLRGDIDYATRTGFGSDYLAKFDAALLDPRITASGVTRLSGSGIFTVNVRKEHFKDKRVLQAMQYAMDKQSLSDAFYGGLAVSVNSPLHVGAVAERADLKPLRYPYDPAMAAQLLTDAGWDSNYVVPIVVYTRQMSRRPEMFAAIAQQLEAVGMKSEYEVLDDPWARFRSWNTDTPGAGEVMMSAIPMGPDPDAHLMLFMHSTSWNGGGYASPDLDARIEAARGVMTDAERLALYQEIAFELQENYPTAFLSGSPGSIFLYNARWYTPFFAAQPRPTSTRDITYWPTKSNRGDWWRFHVEQWDLLDASSGGVRR